MPRKRSWPRWPPRTATRWWSAHRPTLRTLFYPALNRLSAQVAQVRDKPVTLDAGEVAAVRQMLVTKAHDDPEFWCVVGLSELALYEAAASQQLHAQQG